MPTRTKPRKPTRSRQTARIAPPTETAVDAATSPADEWEPDRGYFAGDVGVIFTREVSLNQRIEVRLHSTAFRGVVLEVEQSYDTSDGTRTYDRGQLTAPNPEAFAQIWEQVAKAVGRLPELLAAQASLSGDAK